MESIAAEVLPERLWKDLCPWMCLLLNIYFVKSVCTNSKVIKLFVLWLLLEKQNKKQY